MIFIAILTLAYMMIFLNVPLYAILAQASMLYIAPDLFQAAGAVIMRGR